MKKSSKYSEVNKKDVEDIGEFVLFVGLFF